MDCHSTHFFVTRYLVGWLDEMFANASTAENSYFGYIILEIWSLELVEWSR